MLVILFLVMLSTVPAHAQTIKTVLDSASRTVNWSTNAGVSGGIPSRTTICVTRSAGVTTATLNSDIAACSAAGGGVVKLNAGNYSLTAGIDFTGSRNVTLRGDGANQTQLNFTGSGVGCGPSSGNAAVALGNCSALYWAYDGTAHTTWTAGYAEGTTTITVGSATSISVGQVIILDQLQDTSDNGGFISSACPSGGMNNCASFFVSNEASSGGGWAAHARGQCATTCSSSSLGDRTQIQVVRVTGKSGNNITITPGLYGANWRSGQSPQVWWPATGDIAGISYRNGLEDLTVNAVSSTVGTAVNIYGSYESWVKGVRIIGHSAMENSILCMESARCEIRNNYVYGNSTSSTQNYGILYIQACDALIINNITQRLSGALTSATGCGNVLGYNYSVEAASVIATDWMQRSVQPHGPDSFILVEGNDINGYLSDNLHGASAMHTLVRNMIHGTDDIANKTANNGAISPTAYRRGTNAVGNVLGKNGYQTVYQHCAPPTSGCSTAVGATGTDDGIYIIGYANTYASSGQASYDPVTVTSMVRWGNYDTVNDAARFVSGEVAPAGALTYMPAVSVPATQTIPSTFFLSELDRVNWWGSPYGTVPYPPIGPDVSGGDIANVGGKAYKIPARLCWENMADDPAFSAPNNVRVFSASTCYTAISGDTTPPTAPSGVFISRKE